MTTARITAIGTAVPDHDIHAAFVDWAGDQLADGREKALFARMAQRAGIAHRWSVLPRADKGGSPIEPGGFYAKGMPPTSARMAHYGEAAPALALSAIGAIGDAFDPGAVTHIVVASCTGFTAPGIDQIIADRLGLANDVERVLVGFMGCYGAAIALRTARHIVRSEPEAKVLVIAVELSTLHLQPEDRLEPLLAMLLFGDGAAAALVSAEGPGLGIGRQFSATLPDSHKFIRWDIGDTGFAMHLAGEVPGRIGSALAEPDLRAALLGGRNPDEIGGWAVHAGGRSILDAVERGLELAPGALVASHAVLRDYGNMSSATLLFALEELFGARDVDNGIALAFGPGLAAEGFAFERMT